MASSQEREDEGSAEHIARWAALPRNADDYWREQVVWYKSLLFDAWKTIRGQTKGLQRQRRLIRRLQAVNYQLATDRARILKKHDALVAEKYHAEINDALSREGRNE